MNMSERFMEFLKHEERFILNQHWPTIFNEIGRAVLIQDLFEGGDILIQAVLRGKSLGYEWKEDVLTSTIFGLLKYIRPDMLLIPFIESAFLYDEKRTKLWEELFSEGIELRCYREIEYFFWAWNQYYGEPDLILIFRNHIHGLDDLLLVVEAKFKSGKSGTNEKDQLVRYFEAINNDIDNFTESSVSNFKGRKGLIIYLTEAQAHLDIAASNKIIQTRYQEVEERVFHLRWHQLSKTTEKMYPFYTVYEKAMADDLIMYMDKLGLRHFFGISLPDNSLISTLSLKHPIFYNYKNKKQTYFDELEDVEISLKKSIFYKEGNL